MKFSKIKITKKRIILSLIALAIIAGGFFFFKSRSQKEVLIVSVQKGIVRQELVLSGQVKAEKHAILSFPGGGKISWVGVSEGEKVFKGQALTSLDKTVLNTIYQQALNTYKDKQATAQKIEDDVKDHASDETFAQKATRTTAQVARDSAYDSVLAAEYNLRNATLYAPFAGVVASLPFPNPGINVSALDTQVEVVDPASLYFDVDADQNDIVQLKEGMDVGIVLDSLRDKEFKGKVVFTGLTPKSGETSTTYRIKVKFGDTSFLESNLKVGMSGDAKFILSQKEDVLSAPLKFVKSDKKGKYVFLGKQGNKVYIETGIEGDDKIEITNGVKEGDLLFD